MEWLMNIIYEIGKMIICNGISLTLTEWSINWKSFNKKVSTIYINLYSDH